MFPISRDPPEGGTLDYSAAVERLDSFPISRDPPEGGTSNMVCVYTRNLLAVSNF